MNDILVLKAGLRLFRGLNNKNNVSHVVTDSPLWLALTRDDALLYGDTILEYELLSDINLINITSDIFHKNFLSKLNYIFTGIHHDGVDMRKKLACLPLGLPDFHTQKHILNLLNVSLPVCTHWTSEHDIASRFLLKKHRYSEFKRDLYMVEVMSEIYAEDGYPIKWPSVLHDGFLSREICIFQAKQKLKIINRGGSKKCVSSKKIKLPPNETWNKHDPCLFDNIDFLKERDAIFAGIDPDIIRNIRNKQ